MIRCRYCLDETSIGDAHPCCYRWMGQQGQPRCLACEASKAFKRREVQPTIQLIDAPEAERVEWQGLTIRQQFPWTRNASDPLGYTEGSHKNVPRTAINSRGTDQEDSPSLMTNTLHDPSRVQATP